MRILLLVMLASLSLVGCGDDPLQLADSGSDAGVRQDAPSASDAGGIDVGTDAGPGIDASAFDGGTDASTDAGPPSDTRGSSADAGQIFVFDPERPGEENAHPGGGYFRLSGNGGAEDNNTNLSVVDVTDDPLFPGTERAFRNTYYADGLTGAYANHVMFISIPETARFYLRVRVRFSDNWVFGNDQLKFCKNRGPRDSQLSSNTWFDHDGNFLATFNGGRGQVYLFADWHGDVNNPTRLGDDINNSFGVDGTDANWTPTPGEWHWIEWELDADGPGSTEGSIQMWVDGELYVSKSPAQLSGRATDGMFETLEFGGHVWQRGPPPADIYLEFHRVEIFGTRPGPPPGL